MLGLFGKSKHIEPPPNTNPYVKVLKNLFAKQNAESRSLNAKQQLNTQITDAKLLALSEQLVSEKNKLERLSDIPEENKTQRNKLDIAVSRAKIHQFTKQIEGLRPATTNKLERNAIRSAYALQQAKRNLNHAKAKAAQKIKPANLGSNATLEEELAAVNKLPQPDNLLTTPGLIGSNLGNAALYRTTNGRPAISKKVNYTHPKSRRRSYERHGNNKPNAKNSRRTDAGNLINAKNHKLVLRRSTKLKNASATQSKGYLSSNHKPNNSASYLSLFNSDNDDYLYNPKNQTKSPESNRANATAKKRPPFPPPPYSILKSLLEKRRNLKFDQSDVLNSEIDKALRSINNKEFEEVLRLMNDQRSTILSIIHILSNMSENIYIKSEKIEPLVREYGARYSNIKEILSNINISGELFSILDKENVDLDKLFEKYKKILKKKTSMPEPMKNISENNENNSPESNHSNARVGNENINISDNKVQYYREITDLQNKFISAREAFNNAVTRATRDGKGYLQEEEALIVAFIKYELSLMKYNEID
jgi:hypothetical protein